MEKEEAKYHIHTHTHTYTPTHTHKIGENKGIPENILRAAVHALYLLPPKPPRRHHGLILPRDPGSLSFPCVLPYKMRRLQIFAVRAIDRRHV